MFGWAEGPEITLERPKLWQWPLIILRTILLAITIFGLMIPLVILRLLGFEKAGQVIVQFACRLCLKIMGLRVRRVGTPMPHLGGVVANHSSWLDIFSLNATQKVYFVSKAEVFNWPVLGPIARSTGTIFIERKISHANIHRNYVAERISRGHKLLFFPEGTSTDGLRVLGFRSSLFSAFFESERVNNMWVQPVTIVYSAPKGKRENIYGWWGETDFFEHFILVLSQWRQGEITMICHSPQKVDDFTDRKTLAKTCEDIVREGLSRSR